MTHPSKNTTKTQPKPKTPTNAQDPDTKDLHTPDNESLYDFPCHFKLKAMGKNHETFIDTVFNITQKHVPNLQKKAITTKTSKGDKFISVNIEFTATHLKQLHNIYADLKAHPDVLMTL